MYTYSLKPFAQRRFEDWRNVCNCMKTDRALSSLSGIAMVPDIRIAFEAWMALKVHQLAIGVWEGHSDEEVRAEAMWLAIAAAGDKDKPLQLHSWYREALEEVPAALQAISWGLINAIIDYAAAQRRIWEDILDTPEARV